jgi:hypothetical protein
MKPIKINPKANKQQIKTMRKSQSMRFYSLILFFISNNCVFI